MANVLRGGFRPVEAGKKWQPRRREVASGYATNLFVGDLVIADTAGVVKAITGSSDLVLGAVVAVSYVDASGRRVYGSYIPANTTYSPTARGSKTASYAWVLEEPDIEYWAMVNNSSGAATAYAGVFANMNVAINAGDTVYKMSNHQLDGTFVAGNAQFRIHEIVRTPAQDLTSVNYLARCSINQGFHPFFSNAGV